MSANRSFELAIELAQRRRDETAQRLAQILQTQAHAQGQLRQLEDYVLETDNRLTHHAGRSVSLEVLRHHYQFMARLQEAIRMQSGVVDGAEGKVRFARAELAKSESVVMGLRAVLRKRLAEQQRLAERREQSAMDELATQQYLRRAAALAEGVQ